MPWLREPLLKLEKTSPSPRFFDSPAEGIQKAGFKIIKSDPQRSEIRFSCLLELLNLGLRCWGDEVHVSIRGRHDSTSEVAVFGVANLLRFTIGKGERAYGKAESSTLFRETVSQP
jgi:hypothetical protein